MLCFIARRRDFVMPTAEETLLPSLELTWDSGAVREPAMAGRAPRARLLFGVADLRAPNADRAESGQSLPCVKAELSRAE